MKRFSDFIAEAKTSFLDQAITAVNSALRKRGKKDSSGVDGTYVAYRDILSHDAVEMLQRAGFKLLKAGSYSTDWTSVGAGPAVMVAPNGVEIEVSFGNTRSNFPLRIFFKTNGHEFDPVKVVVDALESIEGSVKASIKKVGKNTMVVYSFGEVSPQEWMKELKGLGYKEMPSASPTNKFFYTTFGTEKVYLEMLWGNKLNPDDISFMIRPSE